MQNTRLTNIVNVLSTRTTELFINPWRRIALILISLLLGFFVATAITSTAGQAANWDVVSAATVTLITEAISRYAYRYQTGTNKASLFTDVLNSLKIGTIYGMFVEAFKLNS